VCTLHRGSNCSLARATDDRCGIITSCQSAATSEIVHVHRAAALYQVHELYLLPQERKRNEKWCKIGSKGKGKKGRGETEGNKLCPHPPSFLTNIYLCSTRVR